MRILKSTSVLGAFLFVFIFIPGCTQYGLVADYVSSFYNDSYYITHAVNYSSYSIPIERLPPRGWDNIYWEEPGQWKIVNSNDIGIVPGIPDVSERIEQFMQDNNDPSIHIILYFPQGVYDLNSGSINVTRSNFIIAGDGPDRTVFRMHEGFGSIAFKGEELDSLTIPIQKDIDAGSVVVALPHNSVKTGDLIKIDQELDDWKEEWGQRSWGGIFLIKDIDDEGNLYLDFPLALGISEAKNPTVRLIDDIRNVGIEKIRFERIAANSKDTILFDRVFNGFVRDIESVNASKHHIVISNSHQVVVSGSYIHDALDKGGGGTGYGVLLQSLSTRVLVTDNIFKDLRHSLVVQTGANYNIFSYNYNVDSLRDECIAHGSCLSQDDFEKYNASYQPDISVHGHYPHHILFEGNVFYLAELDDIWGSNGPKITFYRNKILGQPKEYNWRSGEGIHISSGTYTVNIFNNIFFHDATINIDDRRSMSTSLIGGNLITDDVGNFKADEYENSLYVDARPSFWPESLAWPAFGSDIENSENNKIPAQLRYGRIIENARK